VKAIGAQAAGREQEIALVFSAARERPLSPGESGRRRSLEFARVRLHQPGPLDEAVEYGARAPNDDLLDAAVGNIEMRQQCCEMGNPTPAAQVGCIDPDSQRITFM
jgi:hypothetical protein